MENKTPNTVQYKRFNVRKSRYLKSVMDAYLKIIHNSFEKRRKEFKGNEFLEYDVLKTFLAFNGIQYISNDAPYFANTLHQFLDKCFELYIDPKQREGVYNGHIVASVGIEEGEETGGHAFEFSIFSVMRSLASDESIDENNNDYLKRQLMIANIHDDADFLSAAIHFGRLNQDTVHDNVDEVMDIISEKVFPNYFYIDYDDLKDIAMHLLMEKHTMRGFFSERGRTMVYGKKNFHREFNIVK